MTGEPEFHLDPVLVELLEDHWRLPSADVQRRSEQVLQPVTQRDDPAFPAAAITATANGVFHRFWRCAEAFITSPFQQTMEKGAGVRTTGEAVNVSAASDHVPWCFGVETFVVKEFLRLRAFRCFVSAHTQDVANAQGAVGGDPPVFTGLAFGNQRRE